MSCTGSRITDVSLGLLLLRAIWPLPILTENYPFLHKRTWLSRGTTLVQEG